MSHIEIQNYHRCFVTYKYNGITERNIQAIYIQLCTQKLNWQYKKQVYSGLSSVPSSRSLIKMARHFRKPV